MNTIGIHDSERDNFRPLERHEIIVAPTAQRMPWLTEQDNEIIDHEHYYYYYYLAHDASYGGMSDVRDMAKFARTVMVVLNLCSGHRRYGDVQSQVEWLHFTDHYEILVLSIDIAVHSVKGDLTNDTTVTFWKTQIKGKRVVGMIMAPPCETWSVARFLWVEGMKNQPIPLRSRETPWGLQGLKARQYQQLGLANKLLMIAFDFTLELMITGGFSMVEHPSEPRHNIRAPSIWRLPQYRWLKDAKCVDHIEFFQSKHGQVSKKPTTLLALRLPSLAANIQKPQGLVDWPQQGLTGLGGLSEHGGWKTAQAKEYHPSMCRAIAMSVTGAIGDMFASFGGDDLVLEHDACLDMRFMYSAFDPYLEEQQLRGHDCMLFHGVAHEN